MPPGSNIDPEKLKSFNVRATGIKHRPGKLKSFNVCAQVVIKMCTTTTVFCKKGNVCIGAYSNPYQTLFIRGAPNKTG